jgi:hypothetical protein
LFNGFRTKDFGTDLTPAAKTNDHVSEYDVFHLPLFLQANMFSTLSLPFKLPSFLGGRSQQRTIEIDPLPQHDIEHNPERRARTLKQLLKANHSHNQLFYHDLELVNQAPDV